jgi:PAS domain S-box-containing protein
MINNTAVDLTGWKEKHAVGKPIQEVFKIINEGSRKEVENPIKRVLEEGTIVGLANHTLLISRDGREIPISDSGAPIRNEKGQVEGTVLVFRDKTVEYSAEKSIRQNESRLQKAEFISKFGYYEINFNSGNVIASKGARKIYGLYGSNLTLALIRNTVLTEYKTKLDNALFAMIEKGEPYDEEYKIKNADTGQIVDVYSHADYDEKDGIMFGIIQDITERKKIQEELSISEQRYRLLFELSPEAIVVHSEGKIVFVNPAAATLFGVSSIDELIGRKIMDLVAEESKEVVVKRIKEQAEGQIVPKIEEKFLKTDGTIIDAEVVAAPFMLNIFIQLLLFLILPSVKKQKRNSNYTEITFKN